MSGSRRILYVSGTRADFGLMCGTLQKIRARPGLDLQVVVTGMHLSESYGMTVREVEASGLPILARLPTDVAERSASAMARGIGELIIGLTPLLEAHRPDLLMLLGDRGEMLAAAIAALHVGVPVVHLHGGERSGTVDEPVRHAITKLSHWHFVATRESRERVIRLGERPEHVWITGAPSLDGLETVLKSARSEALELLELPDGSRFALVLFHPVVQERESAYEQTRALADAVNRVLLARGIDVIWLDPNADAGSAEILRAARDHGAARLRFVAHLPRSSFLLALRHADLLLGNSSAGIIEAASLGTPVVNIGTRQRLRERNANTLDCAADARSIEAASVQWLEHGRFPEANRYGDGAAGERIVELLAAEPLSPDLLDKFNVY